MIYVYVFLASIFFAYFADHSKDKAVIVMFSLISILIPAIFGGLRHYTIGIDSSGYGISISRAAMGYSSFLDFLPRSSVEPGCALLFYYGVKMWGDYTGAFFLFQLITMTCIYIGAYKHRKLTPPPITLLVFFLMFYNRMFNEIRQGIAASIIFMGLDTLENKQYSKFIIYIAAATLFHYSAAANIPLFLGMLILTTSETYLKNGSSRFIIILSTIAFMMFARPAMSLVVNNIPFLAKYNFYIIDSRNDGATPMVIYYLGELLMFMFYGRHAKHIFRGMHGEDNASFYFFGTIFCMAFNLGVQFFQRLLFYWDFAHVLILAALPSFVKEKNLRVMVFIVTLVVVFSLWWRCFIFRGYFWTYPFKFA